MKSAREIHWKASCHWSKVLGACKSKKSCCNLVSGDSEISVWSVSAYMRSSSIPVSRQLVPTPYMHTHAIRSLNNLLIAVWPRRRSGRRRRFQILRVVEGIPLVRIRPLSVVREVSCGVRLIRYFFLCSEKVENSPIPRRLDA